MSEEKEKLINGLNRTEYCNFLRVTLGMQAHLRRWRFTKARNTDKKYFKVIGQMDVHGEKTVFFLERDDYSQKVFRDDKGHVYSLFEYFDNVNGGLL